MKMEALRLAVVQEKLATWTPAQRALLLVGTLLLLCGGFYYFQYHPEAESIRLKRIELETQDKRLATLKQAASQVDVFQKEVTQSEEDLARVVALLPDQKEIPGLLENVSQIGAEVGLENILFQPQPEQQMDFYAAIPIRLDLVGTYHEVGTFFDKISKLNRILKVDTLTMTRQPNSPLLQVTCTIVTYRFVERPPEPKKK